MIKENEIMVLILAIGVWVFLTVNRARIKQLRGWRTFLTAFAVLTAGWVLTILEGFFWQEALNLSEHICYSVSSIFLALWCWQIYTDERKAVE